MSENKYIGGLEEMTLLAVQSLGKDAYGVSIHRALNEAKRKISIGSLYVTLGRLEEKGYVRTIRGEATEMRGGRAKKYFELTGQGARVLTAAQEARFLVMNAHEGLQPWTT